MTKLTRILVSLPSIPSNQAKYVYPADEVEARDRKLADMMGSSTKVQEVCRHCGNPVETCACFLAEVRCVLRESGGEKK